MKDSEKWSSSGNRKKIKEIPFNVPLVLGSESVFLSDAVQKKNLSADGAYSQKCVSLLEAMTGSCKVIMTTSCTDALEMAAILVDIQPGDEVIMSSFNFVSAANAFVLRGAKICFVDIDPNTLNIDATLVEEAVTSRTKAVVVMHYGATPCDMDVIMEVAKKYNLVVVEDAAHCIGVSYQNKHLGSIGHLGTISFHDTKNIQCGEGGALLINDPLLVQRALLLKDKGTDRSEFFAGLVKKYTWVDIGSSYGLGELNAAFLFAQLSELKKINEHRVFLWSHYFHLFTKNNFKIPHTNPGNGHLFYIIADKKKDREKIIQQAKIKGIQLTSHYEPLHASKAGKQFGQFISQDRYTSEMSKSLIRFPLYYEMTLEDVEHIFEVFMHCYED